MAQEIRPVSPDGVQLAADKETRLKEVPCTYKGDCNMWYYNKDDFCMHCPYNEKTMEAPVVREARKTNNNSNSTRRRYTKRKHTQK